ncbi:hypothetical protein P691DRAFT_803342 [Macrolepiota fuliginosa MF-IS2]|uniref:Uncharacterized protein n=1 Tax=Macrolepiota fuliginosa MF-IS2 TaxID=1400762 RepID=A0A9P5XB94_9AGAR|nr:hypothetical protein P691DRAFT_803342 [Macrolepiota fuliginosa MF-IS2]
MFAFREGIGPTQIETPSDIPTTFTTLSITHILLANPQTTNTPITTMNSKSSSTASLLSTTQSSSKNFEQAFGKLSSSFGFGSAIVSVPVVSSSSQGRSEKSQRQKSKTQSKDTSRAEAQQAMTAYWQSQSHKNFEAAYGNLTGTYGFGGNVPSPKARKV